jgi:hypothetical protein
MLFIIYPLAMGSYFRRALQRNENIDLKVAGPYTGSWIPWMGGMNLKDKYAVPPDFPLPFPPNVGRVSYDLVKAQLGEWRPDIVLTVDAGICWHYKPSDGIVAHVATDPHCLNYDFQRGISDRFFNMQAVYSKPGDIYLPYAFDPTVHYPCDIPNPDDMQDAVLIGMPYAERVQWVNELRRHGVKVIFENGPVFDEYRDLNNHARIGLNWASMNDTNARAFELPAMHLAPVMSRTTDMSRFFEDGVDYFGFDHNVSALPDAVDKVLYLKNNPDKCREMAEHAFEKVKPHTYDQRVVEILQECGF